MNNIEKNQINKKTMKPNQKSKLEHVHSSWSVVQTSSEPSNWKIKK